MPNAAGLIIKGELDEDMLNTWMFELISKKKDDLYRMKGVLALHDVPTKVVFQGVHDQTRTEPLSEWTPGEERINKMVFIGKNLDKAALKAGFEGCLYKEKEEDQASKRQKTDA